MEPRSKVSGDVPRMQFSVVTLFPEMFSSFLKQGVVGQAVQSGELRVDFVSPRKFAKDLHQTVDDRPYGGGDGMVLMAEPLRQAVTEIKQQCELEGRPSPVVVYLSPQGKVFDQARAKSLCENKHLVLVCGRYGGVDERFLRECVDLEISIGDFILSGGEPAAFVLIDVLGRLQPGVLGNEVSAENESFSGEGGLEAPLFTRPVEWNECPVPATLLSGHHERIKDWRVKVGRLRTLLRRPDLSLEWVKDPKTVGELKEFFSRLSEEEKALLDVAGAGDLL